MTDEDFFGKIDFTLEVRGNENLIEIVPFIEAEADRAMTLIAAFRVDSMEMIESARIPLEPGRNRIPFLQPVVIVNPALWHPRGRGAPSLYSLAVVFYKRGMPHYLIEKRVGFRFAELTSCSLTVNGNRVSGVGFEPDFFLPEEEFEMLCGEDVSRFVFLKDSDSALEVKLDRCSKFGIPVVMELTGTRSPAFFSTHPCVCVFTAAPGSEGEKSCRNGARHAPLVSMEQLLKLF